MQNRTPSFVNGAKDAQAARAHNVEKKQETHPSQKARRMGYPTRGLPDQVRRGRMV